MTGFWPIKFCLWIFLLGITFVFPNSAMAGYGQFARILAGIWLLVQMIILLDFIYDVNEWLLKKVSLQQAAVVLEIKSSPHLHRCVSLLRYTDLSSVAELRNGTAVDAMHDTNQVAWCRRLSDCTNLAAACSHEVPSSDIAHVHMRSLLSFHK